LATNSESDEFMDKNIKNTKGKGGVKKIEIANISIEPPLSHTNSSARATNNN
jgi:hypothetical protein